MRAQTMYLFTVFGMSETLLTKMFSCKLIGVHIHLVFLRYKSPLRKSALHPFIFSVYLSLRTIDAVSAFARIRQFTPVLDASRNHRNFPGV